MDFVTASTGLISPYWMGLPIRYIQICRELKQISFFNSEGSPLLHPVALLIIKLQCDNIVNYVQQFPFDLKRIIFVELDTI